MLLLICISVVISDVGHPLVYLVAICTSSLEKRVIQILLPVFKMDLCSLYILDISSICTYFFPHSAGCLFILIMLYFHIQMV